MTPDRRLLPPESPPALSAVIRADIESSSPRRITFARFMERALYEPSLGYYRSAAVRPTRAGDFLTAPETHEIFGWTIAGRVERLWAELGRPDPFRVLEYGAGSGTLALSILEGFRRHGATDLLDAIRYCPVETNPNRSGELETRFEEAGLAGLLDVPAPASSAGGTAVEERVPVSGVLIANEFLDALPVHRVLLRDGVLHELFVSWRDGSSSAPEGFVEVVGEPSTPELAVRLADDGIALAEGQVAEICLELDPWLDEAASRLGRGFALIVDYGYEAAELYGPRHLAGTLLGYRGHRVVENPLTEPGSIDLTAHVDFSAVKRLAERHGFRTVSMPTQSEFLVAEGLEQEWQAVQAQADQTLAEYARARSAVLHLLDPRHLGRFRVLTLERG